MLKISPNGQQNILECMRRIGVLPESPCNGKGLCGKCKVRIVSGKVSEPTLQEQKLLTQQELSEGVRLACLTLPLEELQIDALDLMSEQNSCVLSAGEMPELNLHPAVALKSIFLEAPTLAKATCLYDPLDRPCTLEALRKLPGYTRKQVFAVCSEQQVLDLRENDCIYGAAIDIGTTTVAVALVELSTGETVAEDGFVNPQKAFGLDVLSRIHYDSEHENGVRQMQQVLIQRIQQSLEKLADQRGTTPQSIYEVIVAGNPTMIHTLLGVGLQSLGKAPYSSVFYEAPEIKAQEIGFSLAPECRLWCVPSVSSYVGGDIVAGALVSQLDRAEDTVLFIDIGTNGEMILSKQGRMVSCSCAAGPALEGMNISCGMRAEPGAIEKVVLSEEKPQLQVIEHISPRGVCGSGILDVMYQGFAYGHITKTGRIAKDSPIAEQDSEGKRRLTLSKEHNIYVTQSDIRQVQLCKGAILSGILTLLEQTETEPEQVDRVVVAGQFGKHLSPQSLTGSGLIPEVLLNKISYVGNSSMTGAKMCLLSTEEREKARRIAERVSYIELSVCEGYEKLFARCLQFEGGQQ